MEELVYRGFLGARALCVDLAFRKACKIEGGGKVNALIEAMFIDILGSPAFTDTRDAKNNGMCVIERVIQGVTSHSLF